jgi:hypothetical protein
VLPGQLPVGMSALSSVLDDVYSACGAVAYDEGLQVVRWGPGRLVLLAPIDPGEEAGVGSRVVGAQQRARVQGVQEPLYRACGRAVMRSSCHVREASM